MKTVLAGVAIASLFLGSTLWAIVTDLFKEEVRTRLGRLPFLLLHIAARRLPHSVRSDMTDEWGTELDFILYDTEGLPVTRLLRGIRYAGDLMLRGAPAVAREIAQATSEGEPASDIEPAKVMDRTWSDLFPWGRDIFYEGDDPTGFVRQLKAKFGFDPSLDARWGTEIGSGDFSFTSYQFHCPTELLDAIYGDERFPMGS